MCLSQEGERERESGRERERERKSKNKKTVSDIGTRLVLNVFVKGNYSI